MKLWRGASLVLIFAWCSVGSFPPTDSGLRQPSTCFFGCDFGGYLCALFGGLFGNTTASVLTEHSPHVGRVLSFYRAGGPRRCWLSAVLIHQLSCGFNLFIFSTAWDGNSCFPTRVST